MNDYIIYALYKSRQIASGILSAGKTTLTSKFHITKETNAVDMSEIVVVTVWVQKTQLKYMVYTAPPTTRI
jgi:ribosomal 50S subunit-recycling heat shock protein